MLGEGDEMNRRELLAAIGTIPAAIFGWRKATTEDWPQLYTLEGEAIGHGVEIEVVGWRELTYSAEDAHDLFIPDDSVIVAPKDSGVAPFTSEIVSFVEP